MRRLLLAGVILLGAIGALGQAGGLRFANAEQRSDTTSVVSTGAVKHDGQGTKPYARDG